MRSRGFAAAVLLLLAALPAALLAAPYTPAAFPDPKRDVQACGRDGVASNVCDPDLLLSPKAKDYIDGVTKAIWEGETPYSKAECAGRLEGYQVSRRRRSRRTLPPASAENLLLPPVRTGAQPGPHSGGSPARVPGLAVQVAVAVMRKMEVPAAATPAEAAHDFAKALHERWGVGDAACNNGVLFLLSLEDRQVYISTGKGEPGPGASGALGGPGRPSVAGLLAAARAPAGIGQTACRQRVALYVAPIQKALVEEILRLPAATATVVCTHPVGLARLCLSG